MAQKGGQQDMGLYVHIPFCRRRCHYCDFPSSAGLGRDWQHQYAQALGQEVALYQAAGLGQGGDWGPVSTVYLGGGTPTYLDEDILGYILARLNEAWPAAASGEREFTAEANPCTVTAAKLDLLRHFGVNRLSMGAQSFDEEALAWLGRSHDARMFHKAWGQARQAGFTQMSLDLIYGLPGQSVAQWGETLKHAMALGPEHISLYQLSVEPQTVLAQRAQAGVACQAEEEVCRRQYCLAHQMLGEAGYCHYEISNYARPGAVGQHNLGYWRNGYYLGLGAGAAGYLPGWRYRNTPDLPAYVAALAAGGWPREEVEEITPALWQKESLMLRLRLAEGFKPSELWGQREKGWPKGLAAVLERQVQAGLLKEAGDSLVPSLEGWLQYNGMVADLFAIFVNN